MMFMERLDAGNRLKAGQHAIGLRLNADQHVVPPLGGSCQARGDRIVVDHGRAIYLASVERNAAKKPFGLAIEKAAAMAQSAPSPRRRWSKHSHFGGVL